MSLYDTIGKDYINYRVPDIRIARQIEIALSNAIKVLNVGAGTGSYEPVGRSVLAVEPSTLMINQRPISAAPAIQAQAENLPFENKSFDAAMALLTIHHWSHWKAGITELGRVANRVIIFTWDPTFEGFWLTKDYFPEVLHIDKNIFPPIDEIKSLLGKARVEVVPIPADCTDGFGSAYWNRPHAYLNDNVRMAMSTFAKLSNVDEGLQRLRIDLDNGTWHKKYGNLLSLRKIDLGFKLIICDYKM